MHDPTNMTIAEALWQANQDLVTACLNTPFVQGIGSGALSQAKFAYYIGQDTFFLEAFARAYSLAAAKAPDWQGFQIFHHLADGVLQELTLHETYAAQWQVNPRSIAPGSATRRYTDFLLATAWSQEVGVVATAMLPCMRLYAFLGQTLAQEGIPQHTYTSWIETYSSAEFEPLADQLADLTEQYARLTPLVESTYRYAMQCEYDFFQAAWEVEG